MTNRRFTISIITLGLLACLCWLFIGCGGDDEPDVEATTAAVAAELSQTRSTQDPVVASATAAASAAAGSSGGSAPSSGSASTVGEAAAPGTAAATGAAAATGTAAAPGAATEPGPTAAPQVPPGPEPMAPLPISNPDAFLASVSERERNCLLDQLSPEQLAALARSPELASKEERQILIGCLDDDTTLRLFLTPLLSATGPLSADSSECLRSGYEGADLETLMLAASGDPLANPNVESAMALAMVSFMVSLSCLSEEEFRTAGPSMGIASEDYDNFQCVLREVGGPEQMAALMQQGGGFPASLFDAAFACQVEVGGTPSG